MKMYRIEDFKSGRQMLFTHKDDMKSAVYKLIDKISFERLDLFIDTVDVDFEEEVKDENWEVKNED